MTPRKVLEREKRWALPAGISAVSAVVLLIIGYVLVAGVGNSTSAVGLAHSFAENGTRIIISGLLSGIALVMFAIAFAYLFEAAEARSAGVRRWIVVIVLLGPLMLGVQSIISSVANQQTSKDFVAQEADLYTDPPASVDAFLAQLEAEPNSVSKAAIYPDELAIDALDSDGKVFTLDYASSGEGTELTTALEDAGVEPGENETGEPGDLAVSHFFEESSLFATARDMRFLAVLLLVVGIVYTALWAMRVGLLTRFMGTLGIALGAAQVILGPGLGLVGLGLWTVALGLIYLDKYPNGRPPAWDSGEAEPWVTGGSDPSEPSTNDSDDGDVIDEVPRSGHEDGTPRKRKQRSR